MTLADRLAAALQSSVGAKLPTHEVLPDIRYTDAAVLVAVTDRAEPGVILTLRQPHLRKHAGQIAFPGGKVDPGDADATAAALREAQEEIGLDPALVQVIGAFDLFRASSGFEIVPLLGVIPADAPLVPHEAEVADVFEVPLAFLLDTRNHTQGALEYKERIRTYYELNWGERRIWGVTAGIVVNIARRLAGFA